MTDYTIKTTATVTLPLPDFQITQAPSNITINAPIATFFFIFANHSGKYKSQGIDTIVSMAKVQNFAVKGQSSIACVGVARPKVTTSILCVVFHCFAQDFSVVRPAVLEQ